MVSKKLNRRDFLRFATFAAAGATMAACAPAATAAPAAPAATNAPGAAAATAVPAAAATATPVPPAAPTAVAPPTLDPTAVTWWYAWGNLDAGMQTFVKTPKFLETMGNTKFDFKGGVPAEAILTAVAAGTPPDGGSNFDYPNLFYKGAVFPVNDYVSTSKRITKDDVLPKLWESAFYGYKMIGVPGIEGYLWWGLNANIDVAQKDGLDPTTLPTTWAGSWKVPVAWVGDMVVVLTLSAVIWTPRGRSAAATTTVTSGAGVVCGDCWPMPLRARTATNDSAARATPTMSINRFARFKGVYSEWCVCQVSTTLGRVWGGRDPTNGL